MRSRAILDRRVRVCLIGALASFTACAFAADPPWIVRGRLGMVAADSTDASKAGLELLAAGGNAFDAAIATSLALAVTRPSSTGLGGGGFMVAYAAAEKRFVALDFRETAPRGTSRERYGDAARDRNGGLAPSLYGGDAVAVPGLVAGQWAIHRRFGSRPIAEIAAPAIRLASEGFVVDEEFAGSCRELKAEFEQHAALKARLPALWRMYCRDGKLPAVGESFKNPDLADALRALAKEGEAAFYGGAIGAAIVRAVTAAGGVLTAEDMMPRDNRVREREPLRGRYRDFDVVAMPPPSSGGVCMIETLNILDALGHASVPPGVEQIHLRVEALKHAFADRARWLGDPDFGSVPTGLLIDRDYARTPAARVFRDKTGPADSYGLKQLPDDRGTSHFCVADRHGNLVSWTETINGGFGSYVVADPFGIVLNNQMDDFATVPGQANLFGLVQSERNRVEPGKRPLSSMSPTIVMKDGRPILIAGASGGPRIITSTLNVVLGVLDERMTLDAAMLSPRPHHQWQPDELFFDRTPPTSLADGLRTKGHIIADKSRTGIVQAILIQPDGEMIGASDPKKGGRPAGR